MSEIVDISVPRTLAYRFQYGTPIKMYLMTKQLANGNGAPAQDIVLSNYLRQSPSMSAQSNVAVEVAGVRVWNYTVDFATPKITSTGAGFASGTNNVAIFYLFGTSGGDTVRIRAADANKEHFNPLMNRDLENWGVSDQNNAKERQELRNDLTLPEKTHFLIELQSSATVDFTYSLLEIAVQESPVAGTDPATFVKFTA